MKSLLVFVMLAATMCWFMFSPIYKHVFIVRQAVLQKEVDYLLEIGASGEHGYISRGMVEESKGRLAAVGLKPELAIYELVSTNGLAADNPAVPLRRGTGIILTIRYPYERILEIDRLIGLTPPAADSLMSAKGMKMSEFIR